MIELILNINSIKFKITHSKQNTKFAVFSPVNKTLVYAAFTVV